MQTGILNTNVRVGVEENSLQEGYLKVLCLLIHCRCLRCICLGGNL